MPSQFEAVVRAYHGDQLGWNGLGLCFWSCLHFLIPWTCPVLLRLNEFVLLDLKKLPG